MLAYKEFEQASRDFQSKQVVTRKKGIVSTAKAVGACAVTVAVFEGPQLISQGESATQLFVPRMQKINSSTNPTTTTTRAVVYPNSNAERSRGNYVMDNTRINVILQNVGHIQNALKFDDIDDCEYEDFELISSPASKSLNLDVTVHDSGYVPNTLVFKDEA